MNVYETKMDAVEYSSGKIVSDTMKVDYVRIETSHSKNDSVFNSKTKSIRMVKGINGTSIKTNKKLKFDYCSFYESQVLKGEVYEVKYLPTTHRILSIKLKK